MGFCKKSLHLQHAVKKSSLSTPLSIFENKLSQTDCSMPLAHINGRRQVRPGEGDLYFCVYRDTLKSVSVIFAVISFFVLPSADFACDTAEEEAVMGNAQFPS